MFAFHDQKGIAAALIVGGAALGYLPERSADQRVLIISVVP